MATFYNGFESGAQGAVLATTAAAGETAWSAVTPSQTIVTYDTSQAAHGTRSLKVDPAGAAINVVGRYTAATATLTGAARLYLRLGGTITKTDTYPMRIRAGSTSILVVSMLDTQKLRLKGPGGNLWTQSGTLSVGVWYRIDLAWQINATTATAGQVRMTIATAEAAPSEDTGWLTTNLGTAGIDTLVVGKDDTGNMANPYWLDSATLDLSATDVLGPTVTTVPDTADAGPDRTVVAWDTVTLTGTGTVNGSAQSGAWSQISGPAVTLAGSGATRTFTAAPSDALDTTTARTFRYTVDTAADDTTVTTGAADWHYWTAAGALKAARLEALT